VKAFTLDVEFLHDGVEHPCVAALDRVDQRL
jgi:hypothetical protein